MPCRPRMPRGSGWAGLGMQAQIRGKHISVLSALVTPYPTPSWGPSLGQHTDISARVQAARMPGTTGLECQSGGCSSPLLPLEVVRPPVTPGRPGLHALLRKASLHPRGAAPEVTLEMAGLRAFPRVARKPEGRRAFDLLAAGLGRGEPPHGLPGATGPRPEWELPPSLPGPHRQDMAGWGRGPGGQRALPGCRPQPGQWPHSHCATLGTALLSLSLSLPIQPGAEAGASQNGGQEGPHSSVPTPGFCRGAPWTGSRAPVH